MCRPATGLSTSAAALARLERAARDRSLPGLEVLARPIDCLSLPADSADVIVTSYALHRLRDADKQRLVAAAYRWLKPGGTFVVADMMFGRGPVPQPSAEPDHASAAAPPAPRM